MPKFLQKFTSSSTFSHQLTVAFTLGILLLAVASAIATSWLGSQRTRTTLIEQGKQITQNFARQSILALLYNEGENAKEAANGALEFPDVRFVAIYDLDSTMLLQEGDPQLVEPRVAPTISDDQSALTEETNDYWHFMAYVYTDPLSEPDDILFMEAPQQRMGYVHVVLSKDNLTKTIRTIFFINISIAIALAIGLLLLLRYITNRLTTPLSNLSGIMELAEKGETGMRALHNGPKEISVMAHAFNNMLEALEERDLQLREQNEQLEKRVLERTAELAVARDDALRASQTKSAFLANMSHELRTPLNAIIGYSEILEEEAEEENLDHFAVDLHKIKNAGNHLLTLINNVLDLSKIEAGKMDIDLDNFSIASLLEDVEAVAAPLAKKNQNELVLHYAKDIGRMTADPTKIRQSLLNLISNACKFTEKGTIKVSVATEQNHGEEWMVFSVADTGIGMTVEQKNKIFKDFTQADTTTTRKYGGTGLGLAISKRFCQMMSGDISVDSTLNEGSVFTIKLPRHVEKPHLATAVEARTVKERRANVSNVLLIDENVKSRTFIQDALNQKGFAVLTAPNSSEGLKTAQALQPNAIVINIHNPDFDGVNFIAQVKHDPDLINIPTFLLSLSKDLKKGYALHVAHIVNEPIQNKTSVLPDAICEKLNKSVLILDDEEKIARAVQTLLAPESETIEYVNNASDALNYIKGHNPDIMFLDPLTLKSNGSPFLAYLHKNHDLNTTPVVLLKNSQPYDQDADYTATLQGALDYAEYDTEDFIGNFTHQLAISQRTSGEN